MKERNTEHLMGSVATIFVTGKTGSRRLERPVMGHTSCIKCGTYERYCPSDIITIDKDTEECVKIDFNYCKGYGVCANECPKDCIAMVKEGGGEDV